LKRGRTLEEGGTFKVERTAASVVRNDHRSPLLNLDDAKQEDREQNRIQGHGDVVTDSAQSDNQQKKTDKGDNPCRD
jgi:hypothetical protein